MTVLVTIINAEPDAVEALDQGFRLAKKLKTGLRVLAPFPDPSAAFMYVSSEAAIGIGGLAVDQVQTAQDEMIEAIGALATERANATGFDESDWRFDHPTGMPDRVAAQAAVLAEASLFPRGAATGSGAVAQAFERALLDAQLPVVLAGDAPNPDGPVLIAWDGSPEAARAVTGHQALIKAHGRAVIAHNPEDVTRAREGEAADPARLEGWLTQRGVAFERVVFKGDVGPGILATAAGAKAPLIVMGAYGHSRAGEFLFGGATRHVLRAEERPLLALAH